MQLCIFWTLHIILQNPQASPADEDSLLPGIGNFIYNFVHIDMLQFCMSLLCLTSRCCCMAFFHKVGTLTYCLHLSIIYEGRLYQNGSYFYFVNTLKRSIPNNTHYTQQKVHYRFMLLLLTLDCMCRPWQKFNRIRCFAIHGQ